MADNIAPPIDLEFEQLVAELLGEVTLSDITPSADYYINKKGQRIDLKTVRNRSKDEITAERRIRKNAIKEAKKAALALKADNEVKFITVDAKAKKIRKQSKRDHKAARKIVDALTVMGAKPEIKNDGFKCMNEKFKMYGITFTAGKVNNLPIFIEALIDEYNAIVKPFLQSRPRIYIDFDGIHKFETKAIDKSEVTFDKIYELIRSKEHYGTLNLANVLVTIREYRLPGGAGVEDIKGVLQKPKCVTIVDTPVRCGLYALILGMSSIEERKNLLRPNRRKQLDAKCSALGIELGIGNSMDIEDFRKFTSMYEYYAVRIVDPLGKIIWKSDKAYERQLVDSIYIMLFKDHYYYVNNINGVVNALNNNNQYCFHCDTNVSKCTFAKHKCMRPMCRDCREMFDTELELSRHQANPIELICSTCNSRFHSQICYDYHSSCCTGGYYCDRCRTRSTRSASEHKCGEIYCSHCKIWDDNNHRCYIKKLSQNNRKYSYYAFDIESTIDSNNKHSIDIICAVELQTHKTTVMTISEFLSFVAKRKKFTVMFAHNARGYDNYLIMSEIINRSGIKVNKIIERGQKIIYMKMGAVVCTDSLNHFGGSLKSLIDSFGLRERLLNSGCIDHKGFFPYTFFTPENKDYVGIIPDKSFFVYEMHEVEIFNSWYEDAKLRPYDIRAECKLYCISDCMILAKALEVYREKEIANSGLDPLGSVTIASHAMRVFRANHLTENTIVVPTLEEYSFAQKAMQGGRTNAFVLHRKIPIEELSERCIDYADVVSMYPWVMRYMPMPIGVPRIQKCVMEDTPENNHEIIRESFGFVSVDIKCPRNLLIPVLLVKDTNKNKLIDTVEDITGVFTTVELQKAIEMGYIVTRIYEIHHYQSSVNVFATYIDKYIGVKTAADKEISELKKNAKGDSARISELIGQRTVAKSMLNNLWGKFGQNDDMLFTDYFREPNDWFQLVTQERNGYVQITMAEVHGDIVYTKYRDVNRRKLKLTNTNMAIAAFTTSHARMKLYSGMQSIGINSNRIMYCDTDSIIYEWRKEGPNLCLGNELGDFKLENHSPIVEFAALGPKTYAYTELSEVETSAAQTCIKNKGFDVKKYNLIPNDASNEFYVDNKITLATYKLLLDIGLGAGLTYGYTAFERKNKEIHTVDATKLLRFEYDKRIIVNSDCTTPFGYTG